MQFTFITIISLIAATIATPISQLQSRQSPAIDASTASMSDAQGNVVGFDSKGVNQAAKNSGV
ncbi:797f5c94-641a-49d5-8de0-e92a599d4a97 [Sclerotinia trifoliorum]|uniref:797f5c94-641a-49d5-8de0-e92a599d4a97 n=1 Tax=Sclerotinia trifoliorum TaxID=28548 RepID=A0A8H2W4K7_9HELO|nr:797f5c94-641a-49d5-8de0-e92a599d4a97 [Sclerotinia trifoliorum]